MIHLRRHGFVIAVQCLLLALVTVTLAQAPITFDRVIELLEGETQVDEILKLVEASPTRFTLGEDQIAQLKKAGASDGLIAAMQKKRKTVDAGSSIDAFVVILDASASMKDDAADGTKWDAAQKAAIDIIDNIPEGRSLALIVYGHNLEQKCKAVAVLRPLGPLTAKDKGEVAKLIRDLQPVGHTPIALALRTAMQELKDLETGLSQVILITDGVETCKGDPAAEAKKLAELKTMRGVNVIGYSLTKEEGDAVAVIATSGKGKYYDANTKNDLLTSVKAVKQAMIQQAQKQKVTTMEAAEPVKASSDIKAPAVMPVAKYVTGHLGEDKTHYWMVDLEPGDYQFVYEPRRADNVRSNLLGDLRVGHLDGEFVVDSESNINQVNFRARVITRFSCKEAVRKIVSVQNTFGMVDYVLGVYQPGKFTVPFLTHCPPVQPLELGTEVTTVRLDGRSPLENSAYYAITLPEGDYVLEAEYARVDGENTNLLGEVTAVTAEGEPLNGIHLFMNVIAPTGKEQIKFRMENELKVILRAEAMDTLQTIKLKVTAAGKGK